MKRFFKPLVTDKRSNPEIIRVITFVGAAACLLVFVESAIHYAIFSGRQYDPEKIGSLMDHFSTAFSWIIAAGAGGISARSMTDNHRDRNDPLPDKPPCEEGEVKCP